ncbi:hypothetical protein [Chryseobacterium cucumeris]|uniref:hypothetical protein n=1 Tax=Chryseobacterium cucumeris TaxID=1813611 RepID=UPI00192DFD06|nr:hypothetical protein [Chryseobacterium cucumeris]QRA41885.1 hypothetical protein JNG87_14795 [Chryseobacterium cucumeris]
MEDFFERMNILLEEYNEEKPICEMIEKEIELAKNWIEENDFEKPIKPERVLNSIEEKSFKNTLRNIFDDIDI